MVVRQERVLFIEGEMKFVDHKMPIQLWHKDQYAANEAVIDEETGRTGFTDQGLRVTVLHNPADNDIQDTIEDIEDELDEIEDQTIPNPAGPEPEAPVVPGLDPAVNAEVK